MKRTPTPTPGPFPQGGGESRILVGCFGAPHGVRGEIRLRSFTQDPKAVGAYGPLVAADGRRFTLTSVRPLKAPMLVVRVDGISDRTAAEALTHVELFVDRAALPLPDEDEFYVADLVGLDAVGPDGAPLGTIVDVPNYGGGDLIEVRPAGGGETRLFPFTRAIVPKVDFAARQVSIVPPAEVDADNPAGLDV